MTKVREDYLVGLDIGTNSCGWVATDKKNNILKLQGKTAIGARLFREGQTAAARRSFRTTRRRLKRRKWRLRLLQEIFDPYMAKVDPYFFARLRESGLSPLDKRKKAEAIIFPTRKEDKQFYHDYPTIYHLRNALMTQDRKFDLREVYLAIHHLVKYRGNFLNHTPISSFNPSEIDISDFLRNLNEKYAEDDVAANITFNRSNAQKIAQILKDKTIFKQDKQKQISRLILIKDVDKIAKNCAKQIANAILGYKTNFMAILGKEGNKAEKESWNFRLTDEDSDDKLENLSQSLNEDEQSILNQIHDLFVAVSLNDLVDEGKTLSQTMIRKYRDHHQHYKLLKKVINNETDKEKAARLQAAYDLYVNNRHVDLLTAKSKISDKKGVLSKDDFYKDILKNLDDSPAADEIRKQIKLDAFMPKQRTNQNGIIPYQLHQIELDKIIQNQSKYYPFLAEANPVREHQKQAPYKLDELIRFRVPYYVGPMITPADQQATSGKNFAWMVRKQGGAITPWNFDQKVDRIASANRFIKRMTTKDTYLIGEDVLPANSLLYQRFTVLNELNNIRVNGRRLEPKQKQEIFQTLFVNGKSATVNTKDLIKYLTTNYNLLTVEIKGLSDEKKFNNSLATYHHLKRLNVINKELDDPRYRTDIEKIIEWSTIFEDKKIFAEKLKEINWLTSPQINKLAQLRLEGWGRLSKKLLIGLHDSNGQNIMERLWDSQENFMQIVNSPDFKAAITKENEVVAKDTGMEDILADAYTSPANKKAIRQVIKVVRDITKAASGKAPTQIAIEFARDAQKKPELTQIRGHKLQEAYKQISTQLASTNLKTDLNVAIKNRKLLVDRCFLYFMQLGRDAYTGKPLDIDQLSSYDIDHILPQSFIKDDSLDNRVLVTKAVNNGKADHVPAKMFGNHQAVGLNMTIREMWEKWKKLGLISPRKFNNLITDPESLNKYQVSGFIHRQLVETSQIIKLVATILQAEYPNTEIIEVKASQNHDLRKIFNLYKSREVNDYHHAIDAYLTTITANYLYQVYPDLRPFFVYGKFKKFSQDPEAERRALNRHRRYMDFLRQLRREDLPDEIRDKKTGTILFRRSVIRNQLQRAYNFKYMLISRETYTQNSAMFDQTVFPRTERDTKKSRTLIPRKKELPVEIYGGYTHNIDAYMAIIKIKKRNNVIYKVIGVPMRALTVLSKAKNRKEHDRLLKRILIPIVIYGKNGKKKAGVEDFKILRSRVPYEQLVQDGQQKFRLGGSQYLRNAKQLTLPPDIMAILTDNKKDLDDSDLVKAYDAILTRVDAYLPLFDINGFRKKLNLGRDKFVKLSFADKQQDLLEILNGLHDNPVMGHLKNIGLTTPLGQLQMPSGITLSTHAVLIYQSPTGLFEKKVKLAQI